MTTTPALTALDLFAGTGWGVACQRLGIAETGVEIMPEARAVRAANGMRTAFSDVWEGLGQDRPRLLTDEERAERERVWAKPIEDWDEIDLLIASPPCQAFSMAGKGAGRKALDDVLEAIDERLYLDPQRLREFASKHGDDRIALVLTPLAYVARDAPLYVVLEQVPPVLPVWERYAEVMREWGYSVWTGYLQAEMYGVPQTRKRAILIARADGKTAKAPTPTHSRYYSRDPKRLDEGVLPWVSMAEALGWGMTERPMITAGNAIGRAEGVGGSGAKAAILREKSRGAWQSNQNTSTTGERYERDTEHPAPTLTAGSRSARIVDRGEAEQVRTGMGAGMIERHGERPGRDVLDPAFTVLGGDGGNSQPGFGVRMRSNYSAGGGKGATAEERGRTMRDADEPSVVMTGKPGHWVPADSDRPAPTVTGGGAATGGAEVFGRRGREIVERMADERREVHLDPDLPSPTVAGDPRIPERGWREPHQKQMERATRVSVEEAAALQSYPADFVWDADVTKEVFVKVWDRPRDPSDPDDEGEYHLESRGVQTKPITKTNKFLQVGNAVPPLLAEAILREILS